MSNDLSSPVTNEIFKCSSWKSEVFCNGFCSQYESSSVTVDIYPLMKRTLVPSFASEKSNFFFNHFFDVGDYDALRTYMIGCCCDTGFVLISSSCGRRRKLRGNKLAVMNLIYSYNRPPSKPKDLSKQASNQQNKEIITRNRQTNFPSCDDEQCTLRIIAFCSNKDRHWYLSCDGHNISSDLSLHTGHCHVL